MTRRLSVVLLMAAALSATVVAQTGVTDPQTLKICADVRGRAMPAADRPAPDEARALAGCRSADWYFGFGVPRDMDKARKCAYVEMDEGNTHQPFGGKAILMMIYANGTGVERNYDVALSLACEVPGSPGDVAGRVRELERFKQGNTGGGRFSICDHSSDRYMYGECAQLDYRIDHAEHEATLDAIAAKLAVGQKEPFQRLRQAAATFFAVQAARGQDLSGTFEVQERAFLERAFIASLEQFEQGELPRATAAEAQRSEAGMNAVYGQALAKPAGASSTLTAAGIKEAQEAWLPYRDAWVRFGTARYPRTTAAAWKAWVAQERTVMLQKIL